MATDFVNEDAAVTVADSPTVLKIFQIGKAKKLCVHLDVTVQALADVEVAGAAHQNATNVDFTPVDWNSLVATEKVNYTDKDIDVIAAAAEGYFEMDVEGLTNLTLTATAAVDGAIVVVRWSLR